jgi:hypothetical protein
MQVNFETHKQIQQRPSFGAIHYEGAEDTLRKILSSKELKELRSIIQKNQTLNRVNITLFGNGKKLSANVFDTDELIDAKCTSYSQRFYESGMRFIKRVVGKMEKRQPVVNELLKKQNFNFGA